MLSVVWRWLVGWRSRSRSCRSRCPPAAQASQAQGARREAPARKVYTPARTPWGDPDISGVYTNNDESLIPFERPAQFEGRRLEDITPAELEALRDTRSDQREEADRNRAEFRSPIHWFENFFPQNSRAWLVTDPPDGKVPPQTDEARQRTAARAATRAGRGPADSYEDRSLYDRCISRGLPGSMMPAIYGNAYEIHQGPGTSRFGTRWSTKRASFRSTAGRIRDRAFRFYMGDARGHFEGNTLVVETTNFNERTAYRGASDQLKLVERFKPVAPNLLDWSSTFEDPHTWTRPWTFAMNLSKRDVSQRPFDTPVTRATTGWWVSCWRAAPKIGRSKRPRRRESRSRPARQGTDRSGKTSRRCR